LSYDDTIAYAEQVTSVTVPSLADRISRHKVYLLSEPLASPRIHGRLLQRKRKDENDEEETIELTPSELTEDDPTLRHNALLFRGTPISHLTTNRIFAYATHFETRPLALEWINDTTCVLVFESNTEASAAFRLLQKAPGSVPDEDGLVPARTIPMAVWPPEERINASLGKGEGLRGSIQVRWARMDDVKKRGARKESEFYRRHGRDAGKETVRMPTELGDRIESDGGGKRRRTGVSTFVPTQAELDEELDSFLREDSPVEAQEQSKMRSDHLEERLEKKSLLQRTSLMREHPVKLSDRIAQGPQKHSWSRTVGLDDRERERGNRRKPRESKSQKELDDELDAFLDDR
ncbi:hypothetical protein K488DRAFT_39167, partial [Vararia minispora EC-137]